MRHRVKKIKFNQGKDANDMLMRKMAVNFLEHGQMVTTEKRAKALKSLMEKMVTKAKGKTEADKNYLLRYFPQERYLKALVEQVAPAMQKANSGYIRLVRLVQRDSDAALMTRIEWAYPVLVNWEVKEKKPIVEAKK